MDSYDVATVHVQGWEPLPADVLERWANAPSPAPAPVGAGFWVRVARAIARAEQMPFARAMRALDRIMRAASARVL